MPSNKSTSAKAKPTSTGDSEEATNVATRTRRQPLSQADVPAHTLVDALRVPEALRDEYGKKPTRPLDVAAALSMSPSGRPFKMLTGAAVAYGLTEGAGQATIIALTDLGRRIVAPTEEGQETLAMREAVLRPRVVRGFLEKYDGSPLPSRTVAMNVLEALGVPSDGTERALEMITANAESQGLLVEINGKRYVRLEAGPVPGQRAGDATAMDLVDIGAVSAAPTHPLADEYDLDEAPSIVLHHSVREVANNKVFITHGKNTKIVEQIRKILVFGKFEPVISVERQTAAKPVPEKVMDDMRACGAAIVHVGSEQKLIDSEGNEQNVINSNVLIEIGAAMALYGRKFILLVERGVSLPSNLQGLYEVRYSGDELDHDATMKLLEAFNDFR